MIEDLQKHCEQSGEMISVKAGTKLGGNKKGNKKSKKNKPKKRRNSDGEWEDIPEEEQKQENEENDSENEDSDMGDGSGDVMDSVDFDFNKFLANFAQNKVNLYFFVFYFANYSKE